MQYVHLGLQTLTTMMTDQRQLMAHTKYAKNYNLSFWLTFWIWFERIRRGVEYIWMVHSTDFSLLSRELVNSSRWFTNKFKFLPEDPSTHTGWWVPKEPLTLGLSKWDYDKVELNFISSPDNNTTFSTRRWFFMFNHWAFRWSIVTSGGLEMTIGLRDLHDNLELISDEKLQEWALSPHWVWLYPHTPADLVYFITFLLFLFLLLCVVLASNVS